MPVDQHSDPFEERFATALREAGDGFDADRAALAAAGRTRGRRIRLRRRAAVLSGAAGIALVGVGGTLLTPGGGDRSPADDRRSVAAGSGAAPAVSRSPGAVPGDALLATLKKLLPDGEFSQERAGGTDDGPPPYARLVYDDGKGPALISVSLDRVEPGGMQARVATECPDRAVASHDSCTTRTLPDGSSLMLLKGYEYPDRRADTKWWHAALVTPEGHQVGVSEWNAPAEKDAPVSRPEPPLPADRLREIATAPQWRAAVDALPADLRQPRRPASSGTSPSAPPAADGRAVGDTLAALLPDGLDVVSRGGQDTEYAWVVVDDGEGASLVQINVQPDMRDVAGQLYGDAETLPDGTLVTVRQGPGEKGGENVVMWTVDTMRTDGRRVVVSAFNTGAQHEDATRAAPALTLEQLREIALSPKWLAPA
ncbi:hypothetical protein ACIF8T_19395 [Streptomyces sp. NPDC085946]|uniref:hypothetical protein n=1 Tax=Streptomyces sp. NPDC085946 TaxID=3365744 RepID=UPI0037D06BD3